MKEACEIYFSHCLCTLFTDCLTRSLNSEMTGTRSVIEAMYKSLHVV